MKKISVLFLLVITVLAGCSKYNDDALWNKVNDLDSRIAALKATVDGMNSDITAMKALVTALQNNLSVKSVTELSDGTQLEGGIYYWIIPLRNTSIEILAF